MSVAFQIRYALVQDAEAIHGRLVIGFARSQQRGRETRLVRRIGIVLRLQTETVIGAVGYAARLRLGLDYY